MTDTEYVMLHKWVRRELGKPQECENCGRTDDEVQYDWANISGEYLRDLTDWARLCHSCHRLIDFAPGNACRRRGRVKKESTGALETQSTIVISSTQEHATIMENISPTLPEAGGAGGGHVPMVVGSGIRRLTPKECERLQGFPDNWTLGSDTQRYKQCGNAVTTNVVAEVITALCDVGCLQTEGIS